jgi:LemA protein
MKTGWIVLIVVLGAIGLAIMGVIGSYNGLVKFQENANNKWADVQGAYQRRADLIPNLVNVVKGYADHEQKTLIGVIEQRANATKTTLNVDPSKLDANTMAKFQKAQSEMSSTLSRLLVSVEQYPNLKANENFLQLQAQLEGTENRINVERRNFNEAANQYNNARRKFPVVLFASMLGFDKLPYFEADESAQKAPEVKF